MIRRLRWFRAKHMASLRAIDPVWAWQAFEPTAQRPWSRALGSHLLRRIGFGLTRAELDDLERRGATARPVEIVREWIASSVAVPQGPPNAFEHEMGSLRAMITSRESQGLVAYWLHRMVHSPHPSQEKMTLFWHNHFASSSAKVTDSIAMLNQNDVFRRLAFGQFADLVLEVSRDPAMLTYLDSTENRKTRPNENYARELMELFCLGLGNYTEQDVQELARCFTGWEVRRGEFRFNAYQHDPGTKTIFGKTGPYGGEQAVQMVVDHPATPMFIARKIYRSFVADEPSPSDELLEPLCRKIRDCQFEIGPVMETVLGSNLFFSETAIAKKVRSPIEMAVGLIRTLGARVNLYDVANDLNSIGQAPFYPPNVKGWNGGRAWIDSATLIGRMQLTRRIIAGNETTFNDGDLSKWLSALGARTTEQAVESVSELLLGTRLSGVALDTTLAGIRELDIRNPEEAGRLIAWIAALPEFHLN